MSEPLAAVAAVPTTDAGDLASLLGAVPLFAGMSDEELADFASVFKPLELEAGDVLWRQATEVDGLHVLLSGEAQVCRRLPGEREYEVARVGPGAAMGEIPLMGGGTHSATVRALSACSLVFLHRDEFNGRVMARRPSALVLKRRIVEIACARLRHTHHRLAASIERLDGAPVERIAVTQPSPRIVAPPAFAYVRRLAAFRQMDAAFVAELFEHGETLQFDRRHVVVPEGAAAHTCYFTLNGAVEDVLRRGERMIRVGFAGPGRAFGYLGLLDGGPATAISVARERTVVLAIAAEDFTFMFQGGHDQGRAFAAAVERDLMTTLRMADRPNAYLAATGVV
jgi:CRP-like cAMP-binding protein